MCQAEHGDGSEHYDDERIALAAWAGHPEPFYGDQHLAADMPGEPDMEDYATWSDYLRADVDYLTIQGLGCDVDDLLEEERRAALQEIDPLDG